MANKLKKKIVFLGDDNSINIEIINKAHNYLKNKVEYILIGNIDDLSKYLNKLSSQLNVNEIYNPFIFENYKKNSLNIFNVENVSKKKFKNLLNQINIANNLSNYLKIDLVTMPINKSVFKKEIKFIGMTEYLSKINNKNTFMLMVGERFSVIPLTTHINLNDVKKNLNIKYIKKSLNEIIVQIEREFYDLNFQSIKFLCFNPHCGENNTIGFEDRTISKSIFQFKKVNGPYSADSAFKDLKDDNSLFISMYHDQCLIPFKILNKKAINLTIGLNYRRLSPAHGTANDIKFKNSADVSSYLACMQY